MEEAYKIYKQNERLFRSNVNPIYFKYITKISDNVYEYNKDGEKCEIQIDRATNCKECNNDFYWSIQFTGCIKNFISK
jgi:hypothetical protein